ncbi:hypothetical protein [Promicromonospora sp. NPDC023987]|uniref:hypothetical protein n=1 Tax=Promicromonospora sp. NPDC023987 TaxID=3155360 RepID=UPI0033EDF56E
MATIKTAGTSTLATARNLFTNPSFETSTTGILASGVTVSRTDTLSDIVLSGSWVLGMVVDAAPNGFTAVGQEFSEVVTPGRWYAARLPFRPSSVTGDRRTRVRILFYDDTDTQIGSFYSPYYDAPATSWTYPTVAAQAPPGAVSAAAFHYIHGVGSDTPTASDVWRSDAWMGVSADTQADALAAVATYFDGDSEGASWLGAPHASPSALDYVMQPLLILNYGFTRGSRNVVLEPLGSGFPTVFLRGAQSRSGTLTMLFESAAAANEADAVFSSTARFHFQEPEAGQDFHFIKSGNLAVTKVEGVNYWTVAVEFREVEPL